MTDTPGLLYRADEERNAMEMLTLASLEHLPTAALFVFDLTEGCGCSVQQQWAIRAELLQRFPHKLWIDVVTKVDVLEEEIDAADEAGSERVPGLDAEPRDSVQAVRCPVSGCLTFPRAVRLYSLWWYRFENGGHMVQIQWLPHACRVSAVTEEGLDGLKAAVLRLVDADAWAVQLAAMREQEQAALPVL